MSLISDALKEAQRERSERSSDTSRQPAAVLEDFFPAAPRRRSRVRALLLAGVGIVAGAALVGALVGALVSKLRSKSVPTFSPPIAAADTAIAPARARTPTIASRAEPSIAPSTAPFAAVATTAQSPAAAVNAQPAKPANTPAASPASVARRATKERPPRVEAPGKLTSPPSPTSPASSTSSKEPAAAAPAALATNRVRVVLDPSSLRSGDSVFSRAFAEQTRGNYDRAAELYEKALQIKPVSPLVYNDYGALLASRGNHTAAIAMYNLGLKTDPADARLWMNLGDSYVTLGRHADAMSAYTEAAKFDPMNAGIKVRLAAEYLAIGDTANARRGYDDAAHIAPRDPAVHHAFGVFLQSQRDYRGAIREFQAFVELAPGKFPTETIAGVRTHVARLRALAR
jgi:Tfp pilus assembly protein PilF